MDESRWKSVMDGVKYCQYCGAELIRSISLEPRMVIENDLKYDSRTGRKITWVSYKCPAIRGGLLGWLDYGIHTEYVQELKDNIEKLISNEINKT